MALRKIAGFHPDEHGDWVADLECGHAQHARHNPPWQRRPWVVTQEGRDAHIRRELNCRACDGRVLNAENTLQRTPFASRQAETTERNSL